MNAEHVKVTVGVSGGIAAYKAVELARMLQNAGFDPHVVMTRAACEFVQPLTFAAITGHKVITNLWDDESDIPPNVDSAIEHINEAQTTRALIVAPATANILAKFAHGIADDFLTTLYLATAAPVIVAPAMNVNMWNHPATQANLAILRQRGVNVVEPGDGYLACGMVGDGRLAENSAIVAALASVLSAPAATPAESAEHQHEHRPEPIAEFNPEPVAEFAPEPIPEPIAEPIPPPKQDLLGETILVTAGGTREPIDPVRFIGNRSSGRMGYAIAAAAQRRGARVLLVTAPTALPAPQACDVVPVTTSEDMRGAVLSRLHEATIIIMAAAVSDYRVAEVADQKLHREGPLTLSLEPTQDILREAAAQRRPGTLIIGFAAETEDHLSSARAKLQRKAVDAIIVNDVSNPKLGFDSEENAGAFLTPDHEVDVPVMSKSQMAEQILDEIATLRARIPRPELHPR